MVNRCRKKSAERMRKALCILMLLLPGSRLLADPATVARIMLLGDSITWGVVGSDPVGGFRDDLDSLLQVVQMEFDFVGTLHDGVGFDADHEGHPGYTVDMILADIDSFLFQENPEMVLIHLGTNDISANQGVTGTLYELDSLLARIYDYRADLTVHLCGIIPRTDSKDGQVTELNAGILDLAGGWESAGYFITYVDQNGAFKANPDWQVEYMYDDVHPSNEGYAVMAQTYFDSLTSVDIPDTIPPAPIIDLAVAGRGCQTVLLQWTATGDDGTVGVATGYDVRYSTSPIMESSFGMATPVAGEPVPRPGGSGEEFTVGGLDSWVTYYFAMKVVDDGGNVSELSNVPFESTAVCPTVLDRFERAELGPFWSADPEFTLENGELSNLSVENRWDFMAVFARMTGGSAALIRWGADADTAGINEGGLALMLDAPSPDANGYLIFRHASLNRYELYTIVGGAPDSWISSSLVSTLPYPGPGDVFGVVMSTDQNGHHFDCYINREFDRRVSDPLKRQGNAGAVWSGVMLHGNLNNDVADFWEVGLNVHVAPDLYSR